MSFGGDVCLVKLSGWEDWWAEVRSGSVKTYVSVVLFFLSAVLASPIARSLFFLARKFSPSKWRCARPPSHAIAAAKSSR